jgi:sulfofructose kinase
MATKHSFSDQPMKKSYDVLAIGVAAVDDLMYIASYPPANAKVPILQKERHGGGPACTAIATVGMLHGKAAYCARLGNDELSGYIEEQLRQRNVDTSHIIRDAAGAPYHSAIAVDLNGNRNVFYNASQFREVTSNDLPDSLILSAKLILLDHVSGPAQVEVARKIRHAGVPIVGDIEGCSEGALQLAELVDYLVVPYEFAQWASKSTKPEDTCAFLAQSRRSATVVTAGRDGCYYTQEDSRNILHIPAFMIEAFDTNGCGDTFHGAFALAIARCFPLEEAILFASAAAAVKAAGKNGSMRGWNALPTLEDILHLLRSSLRLPRQGALIEKISRLAA